MTRHGPIRVLVIDDSAFSRQAITRMLGASPLVEVVGVARDGEEALRKLKDESYDVVFADIKMPGMSGLEVAERIKAIAGEHGVPVVESPELARAIYKSVKIGGLIPVALYRAVAEILAIAYRLKGRLA